jgi:hypothetical protein
MLSSAVILFAIPLLLILLVCLLAFVKGGTAERIGAAIILADLIIGMVAERFSQNQIFVLLRDGLTAVALLVIVLRYASWWLGGVMLLYALQFALQAYYFVLERPRDDVLVIVNNADFLAVSLCLGAGTVAAWLRRRASTAAPLVAEAAP